MSEKNEKQNDLNKFGCQEKSIDIHLAALFHLIKVAFRIIENFVDLLFHEIQQQPTGSNVLNRFGMYGSMLTSCINFLQTGRISFDNVALNIMTCFS